jgi:hypothetical protein
LIEASQRMLRTNSQGELGGINPLMKRHLELEIKTLENAPRDADKIGRLFESKRKTKGGRSYAHAWRSTLRYLIGIAAGFVRQLPKTSVI